MASTCGQAGTRANSKTAGRGFEPRPRHYKTVSEKWSGWADSNRRPPGPKPGALTWLSYTPALTHIRAAPLQGSTVAAAGQLFAANAIAISVKAVRVRAQYFDRAAYEVWPIP